MRRAVVPGDQLIIEANVARWKGLMGRVHIVARVGDQVACEGDFSFALVDETPQAADT